MCLFTHTVAGYLRINKAFAARQNKLQQFEEKFQIHFSDAMHEKLPN